MPRTAPLPEAEQSVSTRLVEFRLDRHLTRADLAREINANRFSLANVERGRAPLGFVHGYNLCVSYNLCLRWLATGRSPKAPFTPISASLLAKISPRLSFLIAYEKHFARLVDRRLLELAKRNNVAVEDLGKSAVVFDRRQLGVSFSQSYFEQVIGFIHDRAAEMTDKQRIAFSHQLKDVAFLFWKQAQEWVRKQSLTAPGNTATIADVSSEKQIPKKIPTWKQLVSALRAKTKAPGAKTQLARELTTSRQNIHKWLRGGGEPGAELTLKVLQWVQDHPD